MEVEHDRMMMVIIFKWVSSEEENQVWLGLMEIKFLY